MNTQLSVGMLLKAKNPCTMHHNGKDALVVGKEYPIEKISTKSLWVRSNEYDLHEFDFDDTPANWQDFFDVAAQGAKVTLPNFVEQVKLVIPDGYVIDVENTNLAEGLIRYKKDKPKRPMSMKDLGEVFNGFYIDNYNKVEELNNPINDPINYNTWPSKEWAESIQAQCKLVRLRDAWNGEWKPDWTTIDDKWCIDISSNDLIVELWRNSLQFLAFPSQEIANEFLATFRDIIKTYFKPYKS